MTGAFAAALGVTAADISGQTFSKSVAGNYAASSDLTAQTTISTGRRVVEGIDTVCASGNGVTYNVISVGGSNPAIVVSSNATNWTFAVCNSYPTVTQSTTVAVNPGDVVALGVNGDSGAGLLYLNGNAITTGGAFDSALAAVFSGKTAFSLIGTISVASGLTSGTIVSAVADYAHTYGNALDWCGNSN